jgi:pantoate--beta-alanine ligase
MAADLDMGVRIAVLPTVREEDGLALSSRNQYLDTDERGQAPLIHAGLMSAAERFGEGERTAGALIAAVGDVLSGAGDFEPEYLVVVHPETLESVDTIGEDGAAMLIAGRLGKTRLIDNILLGVPTCEE